MILGSKIQLDCSLYFLYKKHYCLNCRGILARRKREKVIHSESKEAKNYDFSMADTFLRGNVTFITYYFECEKCKTIYEIKELKRLEYEQTDHID